MKSDPKIDVMIEGYTDNTGKPDYNKRLSLRRAEAVRDALVSDGINAQGVITKGFGSEYPVSSNKTEAGRQENRRVEIVVSDENGNFPKSR
jgi:outer membrane protein OmpA-like peptidoglycan-associated protein